MEEQLNASLISHQTLRKVIGILGISLPIILYFGNWIVFGDRILKSTMSSYYYTGMRDVLVGFLFTFGLFLFTYKGYERVDNVIGILAGIFAVGTALFPTTPENSSGLDLIGLIHAIFTILFYSMLVVYALWLFRKTHKGQEATGKKILRNRVYLISGVVMIISMALISVFWLFKASIPDNNIIFWLEAVANTAFGFSWFVKGNMIPAFND